MTMLSRRNFITGLAAGSAVAALARQAQAQSNDYGLAPMEMQEGFDSAARPLTVAKSSSPTFSRHTLEATQNALEHYGRLAAQGGWQPVSGNGRLKLGSRSDDVVSLRQHLITVGDLASSLNSSPVFDSYLDGAVRRYQARHGILVSGVVGDTTRAAMAIPAETRQRQLEINIVRLRAMGGDLGSRYMMMNIPATELEAVDNGVVEQRHNTVIGKPDRESPILSTVVQNINFNPFWTVPASIIRKDLIPLMRKNPTYLSEKRIRIYGPGGQEMQATDVNWDSDDAVKLMFRQDPGFGNSLGQIRINIANKYGVYMHDTPYKAVFGQEYRFDSSGCARIQNIRDLVVWILKGTDWSLEKIDAAIRTGDRIDATPTMKTPVFWTYVTAWGTPEGIVQFRDDVYNKDGFGNISVITQTKEG